MEEHHLIQRKGGCRRIIWSTLGAEVNRWSGNARDRICSSFHETSHPTSSASWPWDVAIYQCCRGERSLLQLAPIHLHQLSAIKHFSATVAREKDHFCKGNLALSIFLFYYCFFTFLFYFILFASLYR